MPIKRICNHCDREVFQDPNDSECPDCRQPLTVIHGSNPLSRGPGKIIAFYGPQRAGKSEAARSVVESLPNFRLASFADPLYRMMSSLLQQPARKIDKSKPLEQLCGCTLRRALQTLGTEWGRQTMGDTIWCQALRREIEAATREGVNVVIDDLRFRNEYEMLRELGATIIRVDSNYQRFAQAAHGSEVEWVEFEPDITFTNPMNGVQEWWEFVGAGVSHLLDPALREEGGPSEVAYPKCSEPMRALRTDSFICPDYRHGGEGSRPASGSPCCGIEAEVCADIAARQQLGIDKCGVTVAENDPPLKEWLQHDYEEALDQAIRLKRAIAEIVKGQAESHE